MSKQINRIGEKFITNEGYNVEIIGYLNSRNVTIKFDDETILTNISTNNLVKGNVKNPNHKSIYNVGFIGEGSFTPAKDKKITISYQKWASMIERCYNSKYHIKRPTYKNCEVCKEWHNYQNFAKWFEENFDYKIMNGWELDKDILVRDNKIYSPDTCCFVPKEINCLLIKCIDFKYNDLPIGVYKRKNKFIANVSEESTTIYLGMFDTIDEAFNIYKIAKENQIKKMANKWKGIITDSVYNSLINFKIKKSC